MISSKSVSSRTEKYINILKKFKLFKIMKESNIILGKKASSIIIIIIIINVLLCENYVNLYVNQK